IARAGADLEHLLALLHVDRARHAPDDARAGNRPPEADVEDRVVVGAVDILTLLSTRPVGLNDRISRSPCADAVWIDGFLRR
ncbi:MAG: hypothetical protein ACREC1_09085, partial [Methylovirgula sp.]